MLKLLLFTLLLTISAISPVAANDVSKRTSAEVGQTLSLAPYISYFIDYDNNWPDQNIVTGFHDTAFRKNTANTLVLGYQDYPVWLRFDFNELRKATGWRLRQVFLQLANPQLDTVTLYTRDDKIVSEKQGKRHQHDDANGLLQGPSFFMDFQQRQIQTVYLKVESSSALVIPIYLHSQAGFSHRLEQKTVATVIMLGVLLVLTAICVGLLFWSRSKFSGNLIVYTIFIAVYCCFEFGVLSNTGSYLRNAGGSLSFGLSLAFLTLTLQALVNLKDTAAFIHYSFTALFGAILISVAASLIISKLSTLHLWYDSISILILTALSVITAKAIIHQDCRGALGLSVVLIALIGAVFSSLVNFSFLSPILLDYNFRIICMLITIAVLLAARAPSLRQNWVDGTQPGGLSNIMQTYQSMKKATGLRNAYVGSYGSDIGMHFKSLKEHLNKLHDEPDNDAANKRLKKIQKSLTQLEKATVNEATNKAYEARHSDEDKYTRKSEAVSNVKPSSTKKQTSNLLIKPKDKKSTTQSTQLAVLKAATLRSDSVDILLVEPNDDRLRSLSSSCRRLGFRIHTADNSQSASHLMLVEKVDCIIMNCDKSSTDAFATVSKIKSSERTKSLPIIAISANPTQELRANCRKNGIRYLLEYPIRNDLLQATLQRATAGSPVEDIV